MDLRYFSPIEAFALLPSATDRLADDFRACGATSYERAQPFHPRSVWHESTFQYFALALPVPSPSALVISPAFESIMPVSLPTAII